MTMMPMMAACLCLNSQPHLDDYEWSWAATLVPSFYYADDDVVRFPDPLAIGSQLGNLTNDTDFFQIYSERLWQHYHELPQVELVTLHWATICITTFFVNLSQSLDSGLWIASSFNATMKEQLIHVMQLMWLAHKTATSCRRSSATVAAGGHATRARNLLLNDSMIQAIFFHGFFESWKLWLGKSGTFYLCKSCWHFWGVADVLWGVGRVWG